MNYTTGGNPNLLVKQWRTWQFARGLAKRTVEDRIAAVNRMATWCRIEPHTATTEDIAEYLASGEWSGNTRWTYHTNLSAWFLWLQRMEHRLDNPMLKLDRPKQAKGEPRPVSNEDVRRILGVRMRRRTRAMILLALFAGLRVHEIAKIKGEHLDLTNRTLFVNGKGNVNATLPMHERIAEIAYQMPRTGYWFPSARNRSGHQRRESVSQTVSETITRAGVVGTAHCLRHWFGTALVEAGVDLRVVQTLLRHRNLATTEIYTKVSLARRVKGIERLDPNRTVPLVEITPEIRAAVIAALADEFSQDRAA